MNPTFHPKPESMEALNEPLEVTHLLFDRQREILAELVEVLKKPQPPTSVCGNPVEDLTRMADVEGVFFFRIGNWYVAAGAEPDDLQLFASLNGRCHDLGILLHETTIASASYTPRAELPGVVNTFNPAGSNRSRRRAARQKA